MSVEYELKEARGTNGTKSNKKKIKCKLQQISTKVSLQEEGEQLMEKWRRSRGREC